MKLFANFLGQDEEIQEINQFLWNRIVVVTTSENKTLWIPIEKAFLQ